MPACAGRSFHPSSTSTNRRTSHRCRRSGAQAGRLPRRSRLAASIVHAVPLPRSWTGAMPAPTGGHGAVRYVRFVAQQGRDLVGRDAHGAGGPRAIKCVFDKNALFRRVRVTCAHRTGKYSPMSVAQRGLHWHECQVRRARCLPVSCRPLSRWPVSRRRDPVAMLKAPVRWRLTLVRPLGATDNPAARRVRLHAPRLAP